MLKLPEDRTETHFDDYKKAYTDNQAAVEANRCLYCVDAPCIKACPTSINIPEFIRKIATGNVKGSAKTIFESNILGMSCARVCPVEVLCVGDCVYNEMGVPPIEIGKLQRYSTDTAYEEGWEYFEAGPDTGHSVAVVGGGPAGLAAAHELRRYGHAVTIFEAGDILGGLNTTGVAPYKMKADASVAEVQWILNIGGIDVKTNTTVGKDIGWEELDQKFDAVFVGIGIGPDKTLDTPGEDLDGVIGAVDWIAQMKLGTYDMSGIEHAVVVGGGNTAMDCLRELCGLDVPHVTMVYRGDEDRMSGYDHEWDAAKKLGARPEWLSLPLEYQGSGKVESVRCQRLDSDRKPIAGDEFTLQADLVLLGVGQTKLGEQLEPLGVEVEWGRLLVDHHGGLNRKGWFAGGDASNGAKEVVNAAAEGKLAARSIHNYLSAATTAPGDL